MAKRSKPPAAPPWFVYLLRCADDSLYTGVSTDVLRRSGQHAAGTASRYTRARLPVQVVYQEGPYSRGQALRREARVKAFTKRAKEVLVRQIG